MRNIEIKHYKREKQQDSELNTFDIYKYNDCFKSNVYQNFGEHQIQHYGEDIYNVFVVYVKKDIFEKHNIKIKDGFAFLDNQYVIQKILKYSKHYIVEVLKDEINTEE